jgi:predicted metalloprotease
MRAKTATLWAFSVMVLPLAVGCGGGDDTVSTNEIEEKAKTALTKEAGQAPKSISCPNDLDAEQGAKETCTLTDNQGNTYDMTAEITSVDGDNVEFHFQVANQPNPASTSTTTTTTQEGSPTSGGLPPIENDLGPRAYRRTLADIFFLLDSYWSRAVPKLGGDYSPPQKLISYWNPATTPTCEGKPEERNNAEYCDDPDSIAWDGRWIGGFYDKLGPPAVTFILAHEYGHLVQDRIGTFGKYPYQIEEELNADCLAGAFLGQVNANLYRFTRADYQSLYDSVLDVADPRGLPWQNPEAHGTANQRSTAIDFGARRGALACVQRLKPGFLGR